MVTITLQFKTISEDGAKVYQPSSAFSQLVCMLKEVERVNDEIVKKLMEEGYLVIIED